MSDSISTSNRAGKRYTLLSPHHDVGWTAGTIVVLCYDDKTSCPGFCLSRDYTGPLTRDQWLSRTFKGKYLVLDEDVILFTGSPPSRAGNTYVLKDNVDKIGWRTGEFVVLCYDDNTDSPGFCKLQDYTSPLTPVMWLNFDKPCAFVHMSKVDMICRDTVITPNPVTNPAEFPRTERESIEPFSPRWMKPGDNDAGTLYYIVNVNEKTSECQFTRVYSPMLSRVILKDGCFFGDIHELDRCDLARLASQGYPSKFSAYPTGSSASPAGKWMRWGNGGRLEFIEDLGDANFYHYSSYVTDRRDCVIDRQQVRGSNTADSLRPLLQSDVLFLREHGYSIFSNQRMMRKEETRQAIEQINNMSAGNKLQFPTREEDINQFSRPSIQSYNLNFTSSED